MYSDSLKNFILGMLEKNPIKRPSINKLKENFPKE